MWDCRVKVGVTVVGDLRYSFWTSFDKKIILPIVREVLAF